MTNEELAELERLLEASNSKSLHPEDVASARFRLGKIARDGRLQSLIATAREAEAMRAENARLREVNARLSEQVSRFSIGDALMPTLGDQLSAALKQGEVK